MKKIILSIIICFSFLCIGGFAEAANLFVSPTGGLTACGQADPCDLATALALTADGDHLYLAGGTYTSTSPLAVVGLPATCVVQGGWDGTAATPPVIDPDAYATIIDGENARRGVDVCGGCNALLEDLTVRNGFHTVRGGGINGTDSSILLRNVTVEACGVDSGGVTDTYGGGLYMSGGALLVRSSTFSRNGAQCDTCSTFQGGAMYLNDIEYLEIQDSLIEKNDAWVAPGIAMWSTERSDVVINRSTFDRNGRYLSVYPSFAGYSGALEILNSNIYIQDSVFSDNNGGNDAGTMRIFDSDLHMDRNIVTGNESFQTAGLYIQGTTFELRNNLLAGNQPGNSSEPVAGVNLKSGSGGTMEHNTIVGVAGAYKGRGIYTAVSSSVTAKNTILSRLDTGIYVEAGTTADLDGTLWGTGAWANGADTFVAGGGTLTTGTTNVNGDPGFSDPASGDFRPASSSAARDAGIAALVYYDLDHAPRDASPDIGAYEYASRPVVCYPFPGEAVPSGSDYTVRWAAPENAQTFTVKYSLNNGRTWNLISRNVTGNSIDWQVPKPRRNKKRCRIKVIAFDGTGSRIGASRSKAFTVEVVSVFAPEEGETYTGGGQGYIFWVTNGTRQRVAQVLLRYTKNGGRTWKRILPAPDPFNPTLHLWNVPLLARQRDKCRVKVILKSAGGKTIGTAVSEGFFTIAVP